jgi:hypothetical protein
MTIWKGFSLPVKYTRNIYWKMGKIKQKAGEKMCCAQ